MRRVATALAILSLAAAGIVGSAPAAQAADACQYTAPVVDQTEFTIDLNKAGVTATITVTATGCDYNQTVGRNLFWVGCDGLHCGELARLGEVSGNSDANWTWSGYANFGTTNPAGTYPTQVDIVTDDTWCCTEPENRIGSLTAPSITERYLTKVSANAAPEPVRKNKTITVKGTLKRVNWYEYGPQGKVRSGWHKMKGYTAELQFRTLDGEYTFINAVTSKGKGALTAKVKATSDGCYRFVYEGSDTREPSQSVGDCVDVRK